MCGHILVLILFISLGICFGHTETFDLSGYIDLLSDSVR